MPINVSITATVSDENKVDFPWVVSTWDGSKNIIVGQIIKDEDGIWFDARNELMGADLLHKIVHKMDLLAKG